MLVEDHADVSEARPCAAGGFTAGRRSCPLVAALPCSSGIAVLATPAQCEVFGQEPHDVPTNGDGDSGAPGAARQARHHSWSHVARSLTRARLRAHRSSPHPDLHEPHGLGLTPSDPTSREGAFGKPLGEPGGADGPQWRVLLTCVDPRLSGHYQLARAAESLHAARTMERRGEGIEPSKPGAARPCQF
jgi:hypothetical protein